MKKTVLIIEPKDKHWTTVEPLVLSFLFNSWKVVVYSNKATNGLIKKQIKSFKLKNNIILLNISFRNLIKLLFYSNSRIIIAANKFFYNKYSRKSLKSAIRFVAAQILKIIFLYLTPKKTFFIMTSHWVDGSIRWPSLIKQSKIMIFFDKLLWKKAIQRKDAVNVYSSLIKKETLKLEKKPVFFAPPAMFRNYKLNLFHKDQKLKVVIPGRINLRKRYYIWIDKFSPKDKMSFILLGKMDSSECLKTITHFEKKGYKQLFCRAGKLIENEQYDNTIISSDILLAPLKKPENYHRAIDSNTGPFYDAIRYGKLIVIPSYIPCPEELENQVYHYENDDHLYELLNQFVEEPEILNELQKRAFQNSKRFALERIDYIQKVRCVINNG